MIRVVCPTCGAQFDTYDQFAGQAATCPNCHGQIQILHVSAPSPASPAPPPSMPSPSAPGVPPMPPVPGASWAGRVSGATVGPAPKNMAVAVLLWVFLDPVQYFYIGQMAKGFTLLGLQILFLILDVVTFGVFLLIIHIPFRILVLIDTILVTRRVQREAISPWWCL